MTTSHEQREPDNQVAIPRWRYFAAALTALLLIGGGVTWLVWPASTDCARNVKKIEAAGGARCVGLTDGSFDFSNDPRTKDVFKKILAENKQVTHEADSGGAPYVSIVYLMDMSPGKGDSNSVESVRHELQGAHTEQLQANQRRGQGQTPHIKLLLGQTGTDQAQRDYTLARITANRKKDSIVAVAGLGTSLDATKEMVSKLTSSDIAAFGSVVTADALEKIRGLVRVAAPNADEAAAAVRFLETPAYAGARVLVVQDANADDLYTTSLGAKFLDALPVERRATPEPMQFDSSKSGLATYFTTQMPNLCLGKPGIVYFAGRGRDLPDFLAPLADRKCKSTKLTVLSGDDISQATQQQGFDDVQKALQNGQIKLIYTGLAHPGAWTKAPEYFDQNAIAPFQPGGTFSTTFENDKLDDGQAIMGYDAVLTAVKAIRTLYGPDQKIELEAVRQIMYALYGHNAAAGASGWISFRNNGSPKDKALPVIEIGPDGRTTTLAVVSGGDTGVPYTPKAAGTG